jgi:hypothetical protein
MALRSTAAQSLTGRAVRANMSTANRLIATNSAVATPTPTNLSATTINACTPSATTASAGTPRTLGQDLRGSGKSSAYVTASLTAYRLIPICFVDTKTPPLRITQVSISCPIDRAEHLGVSADEATGELRSGWRLLAIVECVNQWLHHEACQEASADANPVRGPATGGLRAVQLLQPGETLTCHSPFYPDRSSPRPISKTFQKGPRIIRGLIHFTMRNDH